MNKILYSKITKERKKEFQIMTQIVLQDDEKFVVKTPLTESAKGHLIKMEQYSQKFQYDDVRPISCKLQGDAILFPFINGMTMSEQFLALVFNGEKLKALELLSKYKELVYKTVEDIQPFESSKQFCEIFGTYPELEGMKAARYVNVDNILENIISSNGKYIMIDYEWSFDMLIPIDFVIYRAVIDLFVNYYDTVTSMFRKEELLNYLGIEKSLVSIYNFMNMSFNDYIFNNETGYNVIKNQYVMRHINIVDYLKGNNIKTQIYFVKGNDVSENNSLIKNLSVFEFADLQDITIEWDLQSDSEYDGIRIDPMNVAGYVEINNIQIISTDGQMIDFKFKSCNGLNKYDWKQNFYIINDPNIYLSFHKTRLAHIRYSLRVLPIQDTIINDNLKRVEKYIMILKHNNNVLQKHMMDKDN